MARLPLYFVLLLSLILVPVANAATLQINPAAITIRSGEEFTVDVNMGLTGSEKALSTDVYLSFDPSLFEVVKRDNDYVITSGKLFASSGYQVNSSNVYLYGLYENKADATPISGQIGTVTLRALQEGQGQISFVCQKGSPDSSKVISPNVTDIIDCPTTLSSKVDVTIVPPGTVLGATAETRSAKPRPLMQAAVIFGLVSLAALAFFSRRKRLYEHQD